MADRGARERLTRDFRVFLAVVWRHLNLPAPTLIQYDIAQYLQTGPDRKMIMAFRGVGKSWIYAAYILWRLYCDPDLKILLVSGTKTAADQLSSFVRRLINEIELLRRLRPRLGQRDGASSFDVGPARAAKDPSVRSVGIGGQITGGRADEILADDVETASNALTERARTRLSEAVREFEAVLRPGGAITYLGTPQSHASIYGALPARGYDVRIWPAEVPPDPLAYEGRLAPMIAQRVAAGEAAGAPTDPARFDADDLSARRAAYGEAGYALQFLLDARETDRLRHPLRVGDLIVMDLRPGEGPVSVTWGGRELDDLPAAGLEGDEFRAPSFVSEDWAGLGSGVMGVDPSGRGRDETAYAVVKALGGRLFLTAVGGLVGGYADDTLRRLADVCAGQRVGRLVIEATFGDGMFAKLLAPHLARAGARSAIEETRPSRRKELRIADTLEPVLAQHRLVVDRAVICSDAETSRADPARGLFHQLARATREPGALSHDDRLDALAIAVSASSDALRRDVAAASDAIRSKRLRADLETLTRAKRRSAAPAALRGADGRRGRQWT